MKHIFGILLVVALLFGASLSGSAEVAPLTTLNLDIVGIGLNAGPDYQAVPKGIATQVNTSVDTGAFDVDLIVSQLPKDYRVVAELSGPAFLTPLTLETLPGKPFDIPTLALFGKHTLNNIRLVDGNNTTLFGAVPQTVVIESINDPLITEVRTRELTLEELQERGVTFDSSNFTAYEFTAAFATESGQVPLTLPVIIPDRVTLPHPENIQIPANIGLPTPKIEFKPPPGVKVELPPNLEIKPFVMQLKEPFEGSATFELPPIPGVVVIPGNIGFLHQYFSALAIVSNGAPELSNLVIRDVKARIVLPAGEDLTPGSDAVPGDDPLRLAKGTDGFFPREMIINHPGADGQFGTADDISAMSPAESGQADFTIEGLKEGTHKVEFEISAILDGLPIGPVELSGRAVGAVLVRNPEFSLTMSHPQTVRTGEDYDLFVTVTNTGKTTANLVSVHLDPRAISGATFIEGETPDKELDSILPGSSGTVRYRLTAQITGAVTASIFQSEQLKGRFNLRTGVGERGIPLSPDSLILPYTAGLAPELVNAVIGLLGQAWSVATAPAGALPADVLPIAKQTVTDRAFDLSEAGLRILIGDEPLKALQDLTFDLFGSDKGVYGFDDLRRSSTQGLKINQALVPFIEAAVADSNLLAVQSGWSEKVSYRASHLSVATTSAPLRVQLTDPVGYRLGSLNSDPVRREIPYGDQFALGEIGTERASLSLVTALQEGPYRLNLVAEATANFDLGIVWPDAAGVLYRLRFDNLTLASGAKAVLELQPGVSDGYQLQIDIDGDGSIDTTVAQSAVTAILDTPPQIVAATQIVPGFGPGGDKHGRNIAVLFNETVSAESAKDVANYGIDTNLVKSASLQPGSRMAFLLLRDGIGPFFERNMSVDGLVDLAGLTMSAPQTLPIRTTATGPAAVVDGVVREANGTPVPGATVRLLQYIWHDDGFSIEQVYAIFSEKQAGPDGSYHFDYVLQNNDPAGPFRIEAVHPDSGEVGQATTSVIHHAQQLDLDIFMKARGSISGTVLDESGSPVSGASVQVNTLADQRRFSSTSDGQGHFSFGNMTVGAFSLKGVHQATLAEGSIMGTLPEIGGAVVQDLTIYRLDGIPRGNVTGRVFGPDGVTPRSGVVVIVKGNKYNNWMRSGADGSFGFSGVYTGTAFFEAYDESSGEHVRVQGTVLDAQTLSINLLLEGTGSIGGSVTRDDGKGAAGLLVAASFGSSPYAQNLLAETDAAGRYTFNSLPVGPISLQLIDPQDYNKRIAVTAVTLLNDGDSLEVPFYVPASAFASGTLSGTVYHRDGTPWPGAEVRLVLDRLSYIPFQADSAGKFNLPNLPLKTHSLIVFSAGEVANATATLWYDGQNKSVDLRPFRFGSISGTVYDDIEKSMPTGADVTLTSMQPDIMGWLVYDYSHPQTIKADPQTGRFSFANVYEGRYVAQTSNVFRPVPVTASGTLAALQTVNLDLVLQGRAVQNPDPGPNPDPNPPPANGMGSVFGRVLLPDGSSAGAGVRVTTTIGGGDVTVVTDGNGDYRFSPILPKGNHRLRALDPVTTLQWQGNVSVPAGGEVNKAIVLLGRGSLVITVNNADGTPAADAAVTVSGSMYPFDLASGVSDADGLVALDNLTIGTYALSASGSFGRGGRGEAILAADGASIAVTLSLSPTGSVTGIFVKADGITPIGGGQITLLKGTKTLAFTSTSSDPAELGRFRMDYVPLGDFVLEGFDPTTERSGRGSGRFSQDGEIVDVKVTVLPRGTVQGVVLNYAGTAPIERADVRINVSGVSSYVYSTTTGPDGRYSFAGVPAGRFELDATDPGNGLKGSFSGNLSYENEIVETELHIAPTASIKGMVLLPDGVTPATNARVVFQGKSYLVDATTASFAFVNLATGRSYSLKAYENNSHRAQSRTVTLVGDGDVAVAKIVLRGVGSVVGTIFDTDGVTPLTGAKVLIHAAGLVSVDYSIYSDIEGRYQFSDVPAGNFSLDVTHPQRVTAAAASGALSHEGETVTKNLIIGPVAAVSGRVLMADGVTPADGGGVKYTGTDNSSFTARINADGYFSFENIPVPASFELYMADAADVGFNRAAGALTVNEQQFDVGTIVLDDRAISIDSVDPSSGTVDVPVTRVISLVFSEPFDLATVNANSVYLTQGSAKVLTDVTISGDHRTLILTPREPLAGFSLYKLVVTTAVKDLVGRTLPATYVSTFTTIDNLPPIVTDVAPAAGSIQVPLDGVIRLTFSEAIDPVSLDGIQLLQGGSPVVVRLDLVQEGRVVILSPLAPLAANWQYTVSVTGVRDNVGNTMTGGYSSSFASLDSIPPTVSELTLAPGAQLINGTGVSVSATVTDGDVAFVDFSVDGVLAATDHSVPFTATLPLEHAGEVVIKAVAQDQVGNRGAAKLLVMNVAADQVPTATIIAPLNGVVVNSGSALNVTVQADDDLGVKAITLTTSGALTFSQTHNLNGTASSTSFTLTVPAYVQPGSTLTLTAVVTDSIGQASPAAVSVLTVRDSTQPDLALVSSGESVLFKPGETGSVTLNASDNHALAELSCVILGAASANYQATVEPPQASLERQLTFIVADDATPFAPIQINCTARDTSGNERHTTLVLQVADLVPPTVIGSTPSAGASNVPINSIFTIYFDESLAATSLKPGSVILADSTGALIPQSVILAADSRQLSVTSSSPLLVGQDYTLTIAATLADLAGNQFPEAFILTFTTDASGPEIVSVNPSAGSQNIPVGTSVGMTFTEPLDPLSVNTDFFQVSSEFGPVGGSVTLSGDGMTVFFKPLGPLGFSRSYTMSVMAGVSDLSGNLSSSDYVFNFTTRAPDADLVGLWTMDGDWTDSSGNGNNGTPYNGVTFSSEKVTGTSSSSFDGVDDYISAGAATSLVLSDELTISAWIYPESNSVNGIIVNKEGEYEIARFPDGSIQFALANSSPGWVWVNTNYIAPLNTWTHVAWTYSVTERQLKVFANGVQVYSGPGNGTIGDHHPAMNEFRIGARQGSVQFFQGLIDEVAVYKKALAPEDIAEIYHAVLSNDRQPPAAPSVNYLPLSTYGSSIVLSGTKDPDASIRVNGEQVSPHDAATTWQVIFSLQPGQNILEITSRDLSGNRSEMVTVTVECLTENLRVPDIVGLWHMDGNWFDYSGNGNHGVSSGAASFSNNGINATKSGKFDGVDDYVSMENVFIETLYDTFSMSFWVNPQAERLLTAQGNTGTQGISGQRYAISPVFRSGDEAGVGVSVGTNGIGVFEHGIDYLPSLLVSNQTLSGWNHIVVVYEDKLPSLYVNGVFVKVGVKSNRSRVFPSFLFGKTSNYGTYEGLIDEVTIYNRALSFEEIQQQHTSHPAIVLASPGQTTSYWPGETGTATLSVTHTQNIESLVCSASGAASGILELSNSSLPSEMSREFDFIVDPDAGPYDVMFLTCMATDVDGDIGTVSIELEVADRVSPQVTGSSIVEGATDVSATSSISVSFDESLSVETVNSAAVTLTDLNSGLEVKGDVVLAAEGKSLTFTPQVPLDGSTPYELRVSDSVADLAGNHLVRHFTVSFTTKPVEALSIANVGSSGSPYVVRTGRYRDITIVGSYVVFEGLVAADTLSLSSGSVLTHQPTGLTGMEQLSIVVTTLAVDATSKIDVSGRGYLGGYDSGNNSQNGRTFGNTISGGSHYHSGGSYGGLGGKYSTYAVSAAYGRDVAQTDLNFATELQPIHYEG